MNNKTGNRINELYCFAVIDEKDNNEGVIGMNTATGWVPFVGADLSRVEDLKPIAQSIADIHNSTIRIYKFTNKEQVGEITPRKDDQQ